MGLQLRLQSHRVWDGEYLGAGRFHVSFLQLVKFEYIYMNNNCLTSEKVENIQLLIRII